jgi:hypothetical protein
VLTGGDALSSPEQRCAQAGGGWGVSSRRRGAPGPAHEGGWRVRQLGIDCVVENRGGATYQSRGGGSGGVRPNGFEGVPFIGASIRTDGTTRGGG